jgi:hypothetical protein
LRVPARFVMLAVLCQSVLIALAIARWGRGPRRRLLAGAVIAGLAVDGWFILPTAPLPAPPPPHPPGVAAIVELPLGEPRTDFGAMFRQMSHGVPIANGFSGYFPPHYVPLERTLRAGHYEALHEIAPSAPIAVVIDRGRPDAAAIESQLVSAGLSVQQQTDAWSTFIVAPHDRPAIAIRGRALRVTAVVASRHQEDVGRMFDGDVTTAWGTGVGQIGGEEVVLELDAVHDLATLVLQMGAYALGHPAALEVDASDDRATWRPAWRGEVGTLAVRGAIADPAAAPIVLDLGTTRGRYLRLRQTGAEPTIPWWIADVRLTGE